MTYISPQTLTVEDFLSQYRDNPRYELADGELIDMESTGPHETVSGKLATQIGSHLVTEKLPWFIPRTCLIYPFAEAATVRRPDVVGMAFIGKPKQPTFTVCQLVEDTYIQTQYRLSQAINSVLLPRLQLRLDDVLPR
ncbi:MAG: Uma2 family endonuclease [Nostoc sp. TH1S01]|nr:Uma2 family endonuclease [Nostoc sp. TH1S01]